jgi:hypothetical protein
MLPANGARQTGSISDRNDPAAQASINRRNNLIAQLLEGAFGIYAALLQSL